MSALFVLFLEHIGAAAKGEHIHHLHNNATMAVDKPTDVCIFAEVCWLVSTASRLPGLKQ